MELPNALVSAHNIYIDGVKVPGYTVDDGITVTAGEKGYFTELTVTFAVQSVRFAPRYRDPVGDSDLGTGAINDGESQTVTLTGAEYERYLCGALNPTVGYQ